MTRETRRDRFNRLKFPSPESRRATKILREHPIQRNIGYQNDPSPSCLPARELRANYIVTVIDGKNQKYKSHKNYIFHFLLWIHHQVVLQEEIKIFYRVSSRKWKTYYRLKRCHPATTVETDCANHLTSDHLFLLVGCRITVRYWFHNFGEKIQEMSSLESFVRVFRLSEIFFSENKCFLNKITLVCSNLSGTPIVFIFFFFFLVPGKSSNLNNMFIDPSVFSRAYKWYISNMGGTMRREV